MKASQKHQTTEPDELIAITVRLPEVLHARIKTAVEKRKNEGERKLSMGDWMIAAAREKLDGGAPRVSLPEAIASGMVQPSGKKTVAELRAVLPGVKTLGELESGGLVEPENGAGNSTEELGLAAYIKRWGRDKYFVALKKPWWKGATWEVRNQRTEEQRLQEEGS